MTRLFVLAEKLQDQKAKNKIIDGMHAMFHEHYVKGAQHPNMTPSIRAETIRELYNGTPSRSPAGKLVVDLYADVGEEQWLLNGLYELPEEFVYDVALAMMRKRAPTPTSFGIHYPSTFYHERGISKPKPTRTAKTQTVQPQVMKPDLEELHREIFNLTVSPDERGSEKRPEKESGKGSEKAPEIVELKKA